VILGIEPFLDYCTRRPKETRIRKFKVLEIFKLEKFLALALKIAKESLKFVEFLKFG